MEICLAGETKVVLHKGNKKSLAELAESDEKVKIYSGEWKSDTWIPVIKEATAVKIGEQSVVTLKLEDGTDFKCTPDHKLALKEAEEFVEAKDSKDKVIATYNHKGIKVVDVVDEGETIDVYDMKVEGADNFFINSGRMTILVKTCS